MTAAERPGLGGAHRAPSVAMNEVRRVLLRNLRELSSVPVEELLQRRRKKYRRIAEVPGRFPRVL